MTRSHALPLRPWLALSSLLPPLLFWFAVLATAGQALSGLMDHTPQATLLGLLVLVVFPLSAVIVGLHGVRHARDTISRPVLVLGSFLVVLALTAAIFSYL